MTLELSIHEACRRGDAEAVRAWIVADPEAVDADDEHGWPPLFHAALGRREAIVRLLLEAGADLSARDGAVLHYAAEMPHNKAIVAMLVQYGALEIHVRPTDDLSRQLLAAVFLGDVARARSLIAKRPHLATAPDGRGDQPLHHAARNGHAALVDLLLDGGADANSRSGKGQTVLYCAGAHGHLDAVNRLLAHGADREAPVTPDGPTLLAWLGEYPEDTRYLPIVAALQQ